jgi:hypothetical protein
MLLHLAMIPHAKHFQFIELTHINTFFKTALESSGSNPFPETRNASDCSFD